MTNLILPRRKFLTGLMGLVAAPAVVKASSLMPVKSMPPELVLEQFAYMEYTTGFSVTHKEIEDGHFGAHQRMMRQALMDSFRQTKEIYAANLLRDSMPRTLLGV